MLQQTQFKALKCSDRMNLRSLTKFWLQKWYLERRQIQINLLNLPLLTPLLKIRTRSTSIVPSQWLILLVSGCHLFNGQGTTRLLQMQQQQWQLSRPSLWILLLTSEWRIFLIKTPKLSTHSNRHNSWIASMSERTILGEHHHNPSLNRRLWIEISIVSSAKITHRLKNTKITV